MRKLIVFIIFILFAFGVYYIQFNAEDEGDTFFYRDDFESLDRDIWYVGEWKTMFSAYDKAKLSGGKIKLETDEVDRNPFLLSEPIPIKMGQVLKIKRRVKMSYANDNFTGGLAIFETEDEGLIPSALNGSTGSLGNGIVLVEYVHSFDEESVRPGNNVFRVLPRTWMVDDNYALADPIFDSWFVEELIYDTNTNEITYIVDGETYIVKGVPMVEERIRVYMHGYGFGLGHVLEVDWIEIEIE